METKEYLANFLLNGKKGNLYRIGESEEEIVKQDGSLLVYKDRNVSVYYLSDGGISYADKVVIFSKWFGRIKNSFFTLEGEKIKLKEKRGACCLVKNFKEYKFHRKIQIDETNRALRDKKPVIAPSSFTAFVNKIQKEYGESPSYKVVGVLSESPHPIVRVEIKLPNGEVHYSTGANKKEATENFVRRYCLE